VPHDSSACNSVEFLDLSLVSLLFIFIFKYIIKKY
jgi:hypothetical protein